MTALLNKRNSYNVMDFNFVILSVSADMLMLPQGTDLEQVIRLHTYI